MFLGSSCCNIAENSTFARPLDFACRLNPSFHAFAEACATETLGAYTLLRKRALPKRWALTLQCRASLYETVFFESTWKGNRSPIRDRRLIMPLTSPAPHA